MDERLKAWIKKCDVGEEAAEELKTIVIDIATKANENGYNNGYSDGEDDALSTIKDEA